MKIVADENIPFVKECFESLGQVITCSGREITTGLISNADVLIVRSITNVDRDLLNGSKIRFVGTSTIGCEHIDRDYLGEEGIGFASAPGSNANSVAEYVIASMLEIAQERQCRLEGKTIGIVGVGNVGSRVETRASAIGMKVLLNDPPLKRKTGETKYLHLEELFDCDFITFHVPLTREGMDKTFHIADNSFFSALTNKPVFMNTSRGSVADTVAVKDALAAGQISGAVLDVWENEPLIDNELVKMVDIGTPHIAGYSFDGKVAGMMMIYNSVCDHFGIEPQCKPTDFMPIADHPQITVEAAGRDEQTILHEIVRQIYDIRADDSSLRRILDVDFEKQGAFFDSLRKNYPVRREFQNTEIRLIEKTNSLVSKFKGIGFKVG